MKESDLYLPLKRFLTEKGYTVKAEINQCDVVACIGDEPPVIIELKQSLNLSVILQAVDRLSMTHRVYVGVHRKVSAINHRKKRQRILKLFKRLCLGLILIDPERKVGSVEVLTEPHVYRPHLSVKRKQGLLKEFNQRIGDPNIGGSNTRNGVITAYRQMALAIARYLETKGETKASVVAKALKIKTARRIMYNNVYGWFDRPEKGIYALSEKGTKELSFWESEHSSNNDPGQAIDL